MWLRNKKFLLRIQGSSTSNDLNICPKEKFKILQNPTGKILGCTKEWKVNITCSCGCNPYQVYLHCPKFDAIVLTNDDHYTIKETGKNSGDCLLKEGQPLSTNFPEHAVVFTYIGDQIDFAVSSYSIACS
ncbi:hypothetical protein ABFX02_02G060900 [Erythranthe guttata]